MSLTTGVLKDLSRLLAQLASKHEDVDIVFSLRLMESGLDALSQPLPPVPAMAVIGPTQTGKSTVVNILAGGEYVDTSPLAAHTQRASVLAVNTVPAAEWFPVSLSSCLPTGPRIVESDGPPCLIWDTPDFDSNASAVYRQQVARVCALVDFVVVVLSKEKYADQSVWTVLEAVAPLDTPTIICLNKCEGSSDAGVLVPAIKRRLEDNTIVSPRIPVMTLPLIQAGDISGIPARQDIQEFREAVFERLIRRTPAVRQSGLARLMRENWRSWMGPVEQELTCRREWQDLLAAGTSSLLARYRSEYIDHSKHYDVTRKAILGLLELLEIPALAGPMSRTRGVLTWPFRKLAGSFGKPVEPEHDRELQVLDAAIEHLLLSLRSEVLHRRHPWWRALQDALSEYEPELKREFSSSVDSYRRAFQPRIDQLSEQLYEQLKQNPVTLNALRATRIGADAGGIALAIKTGTLGLYDALFAPAVVSLTSYLTESAVGQYLSSVIARLQNEQVEQVSAIVRDKVEQPLGALQPRGPGVFGMTGAELNRARRHLEELGR